jgi:hypothetical protein
MIALNLRFKNTPKRIPEQIGRLLVRLKRNMQVVRPKEHNAKEGTTTIRVCLSFVCSLTDRIMNGER